MRPFALLLAATMSLAAQESAIGVRVHGLAITGDLSNVTSSQVGMGGAAFVSIPIGSGIILRPLVGGQFIPQGNNPGLAATKTAITSLDLMMDAIWLPNDDPDHGAYLVGSVGVQHWRLNYTGATPSTLSVTRLGANGGLGYQFNPRYGAEVRGFWSPVNPTITASGVMLVATMKF